MMLKPIVLSLALAAMLSACDAPPSSTPLKSPATAAPATPDNSKVSLDAIQQRTKGFSVGNLTSKHEIFVFFDPQCPHCANLWAESKAIHNQVKITWIPVGILRSASMTQAAAILQNANPTQAMDTHAQMVAHGRIGAPDAVVSAESKAAVEANTQLFKRLEQPGVPLVVARHATSGKTVVFAGGLRADDLLHLVGLPAEPGPGAVSR